MLGQVSSKGLRWGTDGDDGVGSVIPRDDDHGVRWVAKRLPRWLAYASCHLPHGGRHQCGAHPYEA